MKRYSKSLNSPFEASRGIEPLKKLLRETCSNHYAMRPVNRSTFLIIFVHVGEKP